MYQSIIDWIIQNFNIPKPKQHPEIWTFEIFVVEILIPKCPYSQDKYGKNEWQ